MPNTEAEFDQALAGETGWAAALGIPDGILEVFAVMGSQYYEQGLMDDARTMFEAVVTMDGRSHLGHAGLGALELREGNAEAARGHLERAYGCYATDVVVCGNLGEALVLLGDTGAAARYLTEAVALDPEGVNPYANRARGILAALPTT